MSQIVSFRQPSLSAAAGGLDVVERNRDIDHVRMRRERLARVRAEIVKRDVAAALLFDPVNIRYATGSRNMSVWTMHGPGRYAFVTADGPVILFEFESCLHLNRDCVATDEVRASTPSFYFLAGPRLQEKARKWTAEIVGLMRIHGRGNRRLAVDRIDPLGAHLLAQAGLVLQDAQEPLEQARMIKTRDEIECIQLSVDVADLAIRRMREGLVPGLTENGLWSILHQTNIAHDGEWIEARLLTSGECNNPWFRECGNRSIEAGDMVSFDTDMVGPNGYLADLSRSFICPGKAATGEQRGLYQVAEEQVETNIRLLKPGLSFREFVDRCWPVPEKYVPHRYMMLVHGAGMVDEYPVVPYATDWADWGYDDVFEENMVVCVESFIGEVGGREGVKLEQQVLITGAGARVLSRDPLANAILAD